MNFLDEYSILGELGSGGFAKVYKVRHNELEYIRAVRVLNETITDKDSKAYQKFLNECKVLLRLGNGCHPNIVKIYRPDLKQNKAFVEMDYIDGKDLTHYLNENDHFMPIQEVLRMVKEISSALAYCHEDIYESCMDRTEDKLQDDPNDGSKVHIDDDTRKRLINKYKVIHNDIHSGNIMRRSRDGSFVLLDFGLAITGQEDVRRSSRHKNGAGEYKAPEKWEDDSVLTKQSDIYSFGVVMYEYLTGRVPFPYNNSVPEEKKEYLMGEAHKKNKPPQIFSLRKAAFEAKFPGQTYQKDYPDWLERAIMKCLEKTPNDRFNSGKELYEFVLSHSLDQTENVGDMKALEKMKAEIADLKEKLKEKEQTIASLQKELVIKDKFEKSPIDTTMLMQYFQNGETCFEKRDYEKAFKWYQMAAELDDSRVWFKIGFLYFSSMGVDDPINLEANNIEAVKWFLKAARKGHPMAQHYLGLCYLGGWGTAKDEKEALKWFKKAAAQGYEPAQKKIQEIG